MAIRPAELTGIRRRDIISGVFLNRRPAATKEKRSEMFEHLIMTCGELVESTAGASVWGILLLAIILVGAAANVFARRKNPKVAMCQILIIDGDKRGNFSRIENAIIEAKGKGADLVCFPEAAILGWNNPDAHSGACPIPGPYSDRLCGLAKKYKAYLCIGIEEKDDDRLYDSAILIDDEGRILLKHRKIEVLPELMTPPYTPGSDVGAKDTKFGKIGLLICADTHREDILDRMKALKPALLLVPYGYAEQGSKWPEHGKELQSVVKKAAMRSGAIVVGTNAIGRITNGPWAGRVYGGQSVAADGRGTILATAGDRDRDIRIVSIKTAK